MLRRASLSAASNALLRSSRRAKAGLQRVGNTTLIMGFDMMIE